MALMSDEIREEVREYLAKMTAPVTVAYYPKDGDGASEAMEQLLNELAAVNPLVRPERRSGPPEAIAPERPEDIESVVTVLEVDGRRTGIRYLGFPGGREFGTFLEALVTVSTEAAPTLSEATRAFLAQIHQPVHLEVFTTPT
ncbi:MAG: hypothetical protein K6V97_00785 [Actinomycetia bacterium]|jgi:alkyl hydroperoxide reductase subunit AhpF|nr:hypothetical protein [Actinomycetes bacterium]